MMRAFTCWVVLTVFSLGAAAADAAEAMLYSQGQVTLNGSALPQASAQAPLASSSSAIFTGDKVEIKAESLARLNFTGGATVAVVGDSSVKLEQNAVNLDHGTVSVVTSSLTTVHDCEITVTPAASVPTEYEVKDVNGKVEVTAQKGDVTLGDRAHSVKVKEGEHADREKACKIAEEKRTMPPTSGNGSILLSKYGIVAEAGGAGLLLLLLISDHNHHPISPSTP